MPNEREIAEIEAVLREHTVNLGEAVVPSRFFLVNILEAARAIAALRSKDREDGAREMRERAVKILDREGRAWGEADGGYSEGYGAACFFCEAEIRALPLQTPKGDGTDA